MQWHLSLRYQGVYIDVLKQITRNISFSLTGTLSKSLIVVSGLQLPCKKALRVQRMYNRSCRAQRQAHFSQKG